MNRSLAAIAAVAAGGLGLAALAPLAVAAMLMGAPSLTGQSRILSEVDTTRVTVGDRIVLTVSVEHPAGTTVAWPSILPMWFHYRNPVSGRVPERYWPDCVPCIDYPETSMTSHGYLLPPN